MKHAFLLIEGRIEHWEQVLHTGVANRCTDQENFRVLFTFLSSRNKNKWERRYEFATREMGGDIVV